ncbi:Protein-glutamate O-methyltransferase [Nymphon striatum]|nr:Protein-glutamate O-methyltransferase [Nymphon striatum]
MHISYESGKLEKQPPPKLDVLSFAYKTVKDRMPVIITQTIDLLYRNRFETIKKYGEGATDEVKTVIGRLSKLRNELQTDKPYLFITDQYADVEIWNDCLKSLNENERSWFKSSWLFAECYMYRRIFEGFQISKYLKPLDPFQHQKEESFIRLMSNVLVISEDVNKLFILDNISEEVAKQFFTNYMELSVWGNKCDLSLSGGQQTNAILDNFFKLLNELKPFILSNESDTFWNVLKNSHNDKNFTLDVVLDNAGFELFTDLCLVEVLITLGLVNKVRFYVKVFPWFVSDTVRQDFNWLIEKLLCDQDENMSNLGKRWNNRLENRQWEIIENNFWTLPYGFSKMKTINYELYKTLAEADFILFKGDLNYRKLFGCQYWKPTTPFDDGLQQFNPSPLCVMRTLKSEIILGLRDGLAEDTAKQNEDWMVTGQYAVIQCSTKVVK